MTRFALFVDGSNLVGCCRDMAVKIDDYQSFYRFIYEQSVDVWKEAVAAVSPATQLRRVYWYEIGSMDEWDLNDPKNQAYLRERFDADRETKRGYMAVVGPKMPGEPQDKVTQEAWSLCFKEFREWYQKKRDLLDGMKRFQHAVRTGTDLIDIIPSGHWKVDFLTRTLTEKGVDASLAVDMVALADNYDVAIVFSGDADSIPSINYLKRQNKHIGAVEFVSGYPPEKKGKAFSSRLKLAVDFVVRIYEMDLVSKEVARKADYSKAAAPFDLPAKEPST